MVTETDVAGYWSGVAADRYGSARTVQDTALTAAEGICTTIGENMSDLGLSGIHLYSTVVEQVSGVVNALAGSLGLVAAGVTAPWGAQDAVDAVVQALDAIVAIMTEVVQNMAEQAISAEKLRNARNAPYGLLNNTWPQATADRFSDASTADGDPSQWAVAE